MSSQFKPVNLISLLAVYHTGDEDLFKQFTGYCAIGLAQSGVRKAEMEDLEMLVNWMGDNGAEAGDFDNFYLNYSIPQIGKEFDLLRFGTQSVVDIEIKRSASIEKITKQLVRNEYYLSFLPHKSKRLFTYVCDTGQLYELDGGNVKTRSCEVLIDGLEAQSHVEIRDINSLFNPANYLVSPFNSTLKFVNHRYFLTKQQEEVKAKVFGVIKKGTSRYFAITGKPGTGKTLLVYDIARDLADAGRKLLIVHCAPLNGGQNELIVEHGWNIICAKYLSDKVLADCDVVVVDEVQRLYPRQLNTVLDAANRSNLICIFSFDAAQCLRTEEIEWNNAGKINKLCESYVHTLTDKIRTNAEIAEFIGCLLDSKRRPKSLNFSGVSVSYCDKCTDVKAMLTVMKDQGWTVPVYTPSQYGSFGYERYGIPSLSTHEVIGQEFDKVVVVIDSDFYYGEDGKLYSNINHNERVYSKPKMFYQIISRTRSRLHILFLQNVPVFQRCLSLLGKG